MRFGVGGDFPKGHQVDYVLGEWSEEDRKAMPERLKVCLRRDSVVRHDRRGADDELLQQEVAEK